MDEISRQIQETIKRILYHDGPNEFYAIMTEIASHPAFDGGHVWDGWEAYNTLRFEDDMNHRRYVNNLYA